MVYFRLGQVMRLLLFSSRISGIHNRFRGESLDPQSRLHNPLIIEVLHILNGIYPPCSFFLVAMTMEEENQNGQSIKLQEVWKGNSGAAHQSLSQMA